MKFKFRESRLKKVINFKDILPEIITDLELQDSFIIDKIRRNWKEIAGEIIAIHSIPDRIYYKVLYVSVDHSVYANELMMMKDLIIKRVNEEFSSKYINNLKGEIKKLKWIK